ncbi:Solute carrier organic anion transporter family member [Gryllus bimaculatus]|nr:Solute carrier organic anion transporter family member [Gryllus bimaculatus]
MFNFLIAIAASSILPVILIPGSFWQMLERLKRFRRTSQKLVSLSSLWGGGDDLPGVADLGVASTSDGFDVDDETVKCGLGPCVPGWLQVFASKQAFLVTFCIAWVLQGMYYTYFVSVITTIEKLFQIQSKTTGIIMSATEIGQIGSSLLLTYYGGQGHRPKWIAWGMVLFSVSSFTCAVPHFMFGRQLIEANDLLYRGNASELMDLVCRSDDSPLPNATCEAYSDDRRLHSKHTTIVLAIFFISLLGVGMGQTAVYTLGIPYIDDNVASRESPLYFGEYPPCI